MPHRVESTERDKIKKKERKNRDASISPFCLGEEHRGTTVDPQAIARGLKRGREAKEKARKTVLLCALSSGVTQCWQTGS